MRLSKFIVGAGIFVLLQNAWAQDLDNSKLPKLNEVKALDIPGSYKPGIDPFVHDWTVSLGYRDAETSDKTRPTVVKEDGFELGLGFRLGESWFASMSAQFADQEVQSQPLLFPIDLKSENDTDNYTLMLGYTINPVFSVAGFYGQGKGSGTYEFAGLFPVPGSSESDTHRHGLIGSMRLPFGNLLTSTSLVYLHSETDQTYPAGNIPPTDSFEVDVYSLASNAIYPLGNGFSAIGNLGFNHIGSKKTAQGSTEPDENWFSGGLGMSYRINMNADVRLNHQRWMGNSTTAYRTTGLELVYRF